LLPHPEQWSPRSRHSIHSRQRLVDTKFPDIGNCSYYQFLNGAGKKLIFQFFILLIIILTNIYNSYIN
jgi:hypothetical protein